MIIDQDRSDGKEQSHDVLPEKGEEEKQYGDWMVVQRSWKGRFGGRREGKMRGIRGESANSVPQFKRSRCDILNGVDHEDISNNDEEGNHNIAETVVTNHTHLKPKVFLKKSINKEVNVPKVMGQKKENKVVPNPMDDYVAIKNRIAKFETNVVNEKAVIVGPKMKQQMESKAEKTHVVQGEVKDTSFGPSKYADNPLDPGSKKGQGVLEIRENILSFVQDNMMGVETTTKSLV